jgi:hypothetical protein
MKLSDERKELRRLLLGKAVKRCRRHRKNELIVEFEDGTRLYVDGHANGELELSVTGGKDDHPN